MYVYIQRKLVKPKKYIYVTYSRENTSGKSDSEKECSFSFVTSSGSHYTTYYYPTSDSTIMKQEAKGKSKNRRVYTLHRNNDQQIESMLIM